MHAGTLTGTGVHKVLGKVFEKGMRDKLASRPDIEEATMASIILAFIVKIRARLTIGVPRRPQPDFPVFCRRLTPGVGYLEALVSRWLLLSLLCPRIAAPNEPHVLIHFLTFLTNIPSRHVYASYAHTVDV